MQYGLIEIIAKKTSCGLHFLNIIWYKKGNFKHITVIFNHALYCVQSSNFGANSSVHEKKSYLSLLRGLYGRVLGLFTAKTLAFSWPKSLLCLKQMKTDNKKEGKKAQNNLKIYYFTENGRVILFFIVIEENGSMYIPNAQYCNLLKTGSPVLELLCKLM